MARRRRTKSKKQVGDYRHDEARRKNNPPAGIAPTYEVRERRATSYAYDPHLDPQLEWGGKAEHISFDVDVVSLHIHERISTRAILDAVRRPEPLQLSLFGETPLPMNQQIEFYQHEVGWANRLSLGDSLLVMNSLLVKEGMAGKVQMIYVDPPYGIKYSSNFQPRIDRRDVKDRDDDLTHEPEQIKAYRDTWKLGTHSWLTYLRDRLLLARELLTESGSIFVQINDQNLHLARCLMDEVFRRQNFVAVISYKKASPESKTIRNTVNYLLWYARDVSSIKCRRLFRSRTIQEGTTGDPKKLALWLELPDGMSRTLTTEEKRSPSIIPSQALVYRVDKLTNIGESNNTFEFIFDAESFHPGSGHCWKSNPEGMARLAAADRITVTRTGLGYKFFLIDDYPVVEVTNLWEDTAGKVVDMMYAVQTNHKIIDRCILMTTDPGDLVFDPTCGSGTSAYCAEKWGRRWITCDTSRVALAIARQRLMTARYEYYALRDPERGPAGGFIYETAPHMTLRIIAHNTEIDEIAAGYQPQIDEARAKLNGALGENWKEWEVPREAEAGWTEEAQETHRRFWSLKRQMCQEIDASIQSNAPQETLYDRPEVRRGVVRVSGPFTVEAIPVPAIEDPTQAPIPQFEEDEVRTRISDRGGDYLTDMLNLLKQQGGVLFPGGRKMALQNLRALNFGYLHAEADAEQNGKTLRVSLSFGPQYGPVTAMQVAEAIPTARNNAYDVLILAGFSFDPEAHAFVQRAPVKGLAVHFANIAPDVLVGDLLKTSRTSQIFTVFGQPDVRVEKQKDGTYAVELRGVDIYDPLTGETQHTRGSDVAAWFLDADYDGMTFHICQAFFPGDGKAWKRLQRALKAQIDTEAFEQMRGTVSFPFEPGEHKRIAVKVIDFRGNEVVRVIGLKSIKERRLP